METTAVVPRKNPHGVPETGYIPNMVERINLLDLYPQLSGRPKMVRCPAHDDRKPSLAVYEHNTYCMAGDCHFHESALHHIWRVFDCDHRSEVAPKLHLVGWPKYFHYARRLVRKDLVLVTEAETPPPLDPAMPLLCHANLMRDETRRSWLEQKYGLTGATIEAACVGHTKRRAFTLPVYDLLGNLLTVRFRRDDTVTEDGEKYFALKGYGGVNLYVPPGLRGEGQLAEVLPTRVLPHAECNWFGEPMAYGKRVVVLTEGEFDALALWQVGIPAVSYTNGAKALLQNGRQHLAALDGMDCVWVAYDMDAAGQAAGVQVVDLLEERGIPARLVQWDPALGKDASELVARQRMDKWALRSAWQTV